MQCAQCGIQFSSYFSKKYCSPKCRLGAAGKYKVRYCAHCNKPFTNAILTVRFCSIRCSVDANPKRAPQRKCVHCGTMFRRRIHTGDAALYCSRECNFAAKAKAPEFCSAYFLLCRQCGKRFTSPRRTQHCSEECANRFQYENSKKNGSYKAVLLRKRQAYQPKPPISNRCKQCGNAFTSSSRSKVHCSIECRKQTEKDRRKDQNARRELRKRGGSTSGERVYRRHIYERDGWRCRICGKKVNRLLKYPHPRSASIDHIKPIAHGGTHEPCNVQLAHWICNAARRDNGGVQQRIF